MKAYRLNDHWQTKNSLTSRSLGLSMVKNGKPQRPRGLKAAQGQLSRKRTWFFLILVAALITVQPMPGKASLASGFQRQATAAHAKPLPDGVTAKEVQFYSEGIQCYGKLLIPKGFSAESKAPAVVLAPGWGETAASVENFAAHFASRGLVAMVLDYRGWGRSGGYLQTLDPVKTDDRLRFSQLTAKVQIRRKRLIPQQQILDIRNALYFLQGEPGVDRTRVGVWGTDMAGGHVLVIAAVDSRIKAAVAQAPQIDGNDLPKKASQPSGDLLQAEQRRARTGQVPTAGAATVDAEARLALAEYHPFWYVEQIPQKTAVLFIIADKDRKVNNENHAIAASKLLKGATEVVSVPATHTQLGSGAAFDKAANAAADWFLKHL